MVNGSLEHVVIDSLEHVVSDSFYLFLKERAKALLKFQQDEHRRKEEEARKKAAAIAKKKVLYKFCQIGSWNLQQIWWLFQEMLHEFH